MFRYSAHRGGVRGVEPDGLVPSQGRGVNDRRRVHDFRSKIRVKIRFRDVIVSVNTNTKYFAKDANGRRD